MTDNLVTNNERPDNDHSIPEERENIHADDLKDIKIYYAEQIEDRDDYPLTEGSLADLIETIRSDQSLKEKIEAIRSIEYKDKKKEKEERGELKKSTLPYFTFGEFRKNRAKNENLIRIKYLVWDPDEIDGLEGKRNEIIADPNTFVCFASPGGNGLKVVWKLDAAVTNPDHYTRIYTHWKAVFEKRFSLKTDPTKDAARACFLSHDPNVFVNENCQPISIAVPSSSLSTKSKAKKDPVFVAAAKGAEPGERTHNLTRQIGAYLRKGIDVEKIVENVLTLNKNNKPPLPEEKVRSTVKYMSENYKNLLIQFTENRGCYVRNSGRGSTTVTTFTMEPKELLVLPTGDVLKCNVVSSQGQVYEDVLIENSDWHSKAKLLKAIGHQDCAFVGTDQHVQALCYYINAQVEVRKIGTKTIGLVDDTWVTKNTNITASGIQEPQAIVPFDKGADAFYNKIEYQTVSDAEYSQMASTFYSTVTQINKEEVILPWLGWVFATPLKPRMQARLGGFPLVFVHGSQGSGKTSTAEPLMRLLGYTDPKPNVVTMKSFPTLKLLSSTNAIPVFLDEYKARELSDEQNNSIHRYMRKAYNSEVESKGRPDQTTEDYEISAPMAVMGEWNINEPAIKERVIVIRFTPEVKKNAHMQNAYKALKQLPLETFMPRYIQYVLAQDVDQLLGSASNHVKAVLRGVVLAPRIENNLTVMVAGLDLFNGYATHLGITPPTYSIDTILKHQLKEITGSDNGLVRSAVDQLIEELGIMALKNGHFLMTGALWHKEIVIDERKAIAIIFNRIFPEFKEYASRTKYEGDLLDKDSYKRMFGETDYIIDVGRTVDFDGKKHRSLCIDIEKAKAAGIDLEGFGIEMTGPNVTPGYSKLQKECNTKVTKLGQFLRN